MSNTTTYAAVDRVSGLVEGLAVATTPEKACAEIENAADWDEPEKVWLPCGDEEVDGGYSLYAVPEGFDLTAMSRAQAPLRARMVTTGCRWVGEFRPV